MTNQVYNCDCMDFMQDKPDNYYDLAIVDPPYFDGPNKEKFYHGGKSQIYRDSYKKIDNWEIVDLDYFLKLKLISKNQIIWGINYFKKFIDKVGHGRIVWYKDNENSNFSNCELASISLIKSTKFFKYTWDGFRQGNKKQSIKRIHPTQKPIALYKWLLKNYAKPGWKIFDSHVGSGSLRIACHDMGFDFEGCEIDKDYWQAQEERYKIHIAQGDIFSREEYQDLLYEQGKL